jgi:hypothetical protein
VSKPRKLDRFERVSCSWVDSLTDRSPHSFRVNSVFAALPTCAISGAFPKPRVSPAYSQDYLSIAPLIAEPLDFTLLAITFDLLFSSCQAVAVSRRFGKTVVPEPSVNVSRTGTRNRVRSRPQVFPNPEMSNPGFFWGNFLGKWSPVWTLRLVHVRTCSLPPPPIGGEGVWEGMWGYVRTMWEGCGNPCAKYPGLHFRTAIQSQVYVRRGTPPCGNHVRTSETEVVSTCFSPPERSGRSGARGVHRGRCGSFRARTGVSSPLRGGVC